MAVFINAGGGGGAGSDECTATRAEVLKGYKAVTKESGDEVAEGTLELTGTAADSQVLEGRSYYNTDPKTRRSGAMPNRGAVSQALSAGGSYTIPAGYHNGGGRVTANSLASQTSGTANASQILTGKTAYVNGSKLTGTMANQGAKTASLNCGGSYTIPAGYHNGSGRVTANSLASQTGGVTADDTKVLSGYTYWRDGVKRTGTMPNRGNFQYGNGIGENGDYYSITAIPEGVYFRNGESWAPEARITKDKLRAGLGIVDWRIKKGECVAGIWGTWEGYIANPTDLYYMGQNPADLYATGNSELIRFESNQITIGFAPSSTSSPYLKSRNQYNLTPYSRINIDMYVQGSNQTAQKMEVVLMEPMIVLGNIPANTRTTLSFDISNYNSTIALYIRFWVYGYIYHIWLS